MELRRDPANHWRRSRQLTLTLLLVWFLVTFCVVFFARELSVLHFFGWPLSFYMAAQGTVLIYVAIIAIHAWGMARLERQFKDQAE